LGASSFGDSTFASGLAGGRSSLPGLAKVLLQRPEVAEFRRVKKIGRRDGLAGTRRSGGGRRFNFTAATGSQAKRNEDRRGGVSHYFSASSIAA